MDNNRDEILNELIQYYDGGNEEPADNSQQENIDDTIVLSKGTPAPPADSLGDTMIVNTNTAPKAAEKDEQDSKNAIDLTTAVNIPQEKEPDSAVNIPQEKNDEIPVEEVFGNLGLDGKPIDPEDADYELSRRKRRYMDLDPVEFRKEQESVAAEPERGIWYNLKPLWVTMIVCMCLFLTLVLYVKGYVKNYIYTFTNNLEFICESLGIDYPFADDVTVNPYPSVLSDVNSVELNPSQAGEGYTERNNETEEVPSLYASVKQQKKLIPFEEAGNSDFSAYENGVVCAKSNYICYINSSGETEWEYTTSVSEPILSVSGNYISVASKNGTRISLYKGDTLMFNTDAPYKIKSCKVSSEGDVVIVTEKPAYKGAVTVINKKGEEVFSWASGVNYITSASPVKGRNIAVVLADTSKKITSYVMLFDINSPDPTYGVELADSLIYNVSSSDNAIYASGDNCLAALKSYGEITYDIRFDDVYITRSVSDEKGTRLVTFTSQYLPMMNLYNRKGDLIHSENIEATPDYADIYGTTVLYNNGRNVICGDVKREKRTAYTAPMSVKGLILLNENTYVIIYENTLEFIGI